MPVDVARVLGLVFTDPGSGAQYGVIRRSDAGPDHPAAVAGYAVLAEDGSGNAFLLAGDGRVAFWDHETDEVTVLAGTWPEFVRGCAEPRPVELDPEQVESVWIDPEVATEMGIQVPPDGWKKKPRE